MIMEKWTQEQYAARLQEMKQEAHDKNVVIHRSECQRVYE